MNIFKKRPLSLILCIMLGGFSFFVESSTFLRISLVAISGIAIALSFIFDNLFRGINTIFRIACVAFAISVLLAELFALLFVPHKYIGDNVRICAKVKDLDRRSYSTIMTLKCESINGSSSSYTLLAFIENSDADGISTGDVIRAEGVISEFESSEDGFDQRSYYFSRGYSARIDSLESVSVVKYADRTRLPTLAGMRKTVTDRLKLATDEHTGGFLSALIMGDKSALDGNTNLNYSIIGISHILALSGMHLVIISETLRRILSRLRLNKRIILIISTGFCLFYMAITGFSASVVRSAVMLTITNSLFLLVGAHDSYTTLPLSVVLILIVQPFAVFDISLWLSAFATLGVLIFAELEEKREKKDHGILLASLIYIKQSIFVTILAVGASYLLMMNYFDTQSVFAPIATLIFSVPINFLIFAGFAALICYPVLPIGKPIILITDTINEAAEFAASVQWASFSMDYLPVKVLIIAFTVLFYATIVLKVKNMRAMISLLLVLFFSGYAVGVALTQSERSTNEFTYISGEASDIVLMKWDGEISLIRNGRHTASAAYNDIAELKGRHITSVDSLVITSYADGAVTYTQTFCNNIKTGTIYMPKPIGSKETALARDMAYMLSLYGTDLDLYDPEIPIALGRCEYFPLLNEPYTGNGAADCVYTIRYRGEYYTYLSIGMTQYNAAFSRKIAYSSQYLIFGSQGERPPSSHSFGLISPEIERIYYTEFLPLAKLSREYYKEKEVPITKISTSYEFIR